MNYPEVEKTIFDLGFSEGYEAGEADLAADITFAINEIAGEDENLGLIEFCHKYKALKEQVLSLRTSNG